MIKLIAAILIATAAAACTIKPGNWPEAKGITVKPGAPNVHRESGDWQYENPPSAN